MDTIVPVCSRLDVYEEVVRDGEAGLLFEPRDEATLGAQLARAVADAGLRERLRGAVRPRPWSAVADDLEEVYANVLARRHQTRGNPAVRRRLAGRRVPLGGVTPLGEVT